MVWAIGCLGYVLLNGDTPFFTTQDVYKFTTVSWRHVSVVKEAMDFVEMCMNVDPSERISFEYLCKHPFLFS